MAEITALFWDVGGVLLTNGWDRASRRRAADRFELDWEDFQDRHELLSSDFETARLSLDEYLQRTVFYRSRPFSKDEFKDFMFSQSQPQQETLAIVKDLARSNSRVMATLNNESLELNLYRIEHFRLRDYFDVFLSSCFLGVRKPERAIYHLATQITQQSPDRCLFIDDRELNLECARLMGMRTIHYENPVQLRQWLRQHGIETD